MQTSYTQTAEDRQEEPNGDDKNKDSSEEKSKSRIEPLDEDNSKKEQTEEDE